MAIFIYSPGLTQVMSTRAGKFNLHLGRVPRVSGALGVPPSAHHCPCPLSGCENHWALWLGLMLPPWFKKIIIKNLIFPLSWGNRREGRRYNWTLPPTPHPHNTGEVISPKRRTSPKRHTLSSSLSKPWDQHSWSLLHFGRVVHWEGGCPVAPGPPPQTILDPSQEGGRYCHSDPTLQLTSCVTLGKLLKHSEPVSSSVKWNYHSSYLPRLFCWKGKKKQLGKKKKKERKKQLGMTAVCPP